MANGQNLRAPVGSDFRRQLLWQKAQDFAAELVTVLSRLPPSQASNAISSQLLRAGASIAANIAEGYGRYSQAAYRSHLSIARGSAFEAESWLDLLVRTGFLTPEAGDPLIARCIEVQKLLTVRMKSLSDGKTYAARDEANDYRLD